MKTATEFMSDPEPAKVKPESMRITFHTLETLDEQILILLPEQKIEEDIIQFVLSICYQN